MDLRDVLRGLRAAWWLPVLGLILGGGVGLALSVVQTPLYSSNTQLFVSTTSAASTQEVFQGSEFSQQRVTSYAQLITGPDLAERVVQRLHLSMSPAALSAEISATPVPQTVLLQISVTDPSPQRAQQIADAVGAEFTAYAGQLETPGPAGVSPVKVTVTQKPAVPTTPVAPRPFRNVALGLTAGLLLGAAAAIARARLDRSVKDPEVAAELAGAPVMGTIVRDESLLRGHLVVNGSRTAEDYRQLRNNLQWLNVDEPPQVIMFSSAIPNEGKTTLVVNLALALADAGKTVTIVEADLRRPRVTSYLKLIGGAGLSNILAGTAAIDEIRQTYREGVSVIAAGPTPPNPGELLASSQMAAVLDELRETNDLVLVDAPPLLPVADSSGLAVYTDGVLLSVRFGDTRKEQLRQAANVLERVGVEVLGVVLNVVPRTAEGAYAYGYGYEYKYDEDRKPQNDVASTGRAGGEHLKLPAPVAASAEE